MVLNAWGRLGVADIRPYHPLRTRGGAGNAGRTSISWGQSRWPTLRLIHLPTHASPLDQVEIYFSVVQRKVITPNDFYGLDEVETRLLEFQNSYEQIATPFEWQFTKADLNDLLDRSTAHELARAA